MCVKMDLTTKETASCVFQLIQVLATANKKGPLFNHGAMDLQTTCIICSVHWRTFRTSGKYHEYIRRYLELTLEAGYHDSYGVYSSVHWGLFSRWEGFQSTSGSLTMSTLRDIMIHIRAWTL